jgi:hypothetical protein
MVDTINPPLNLAPNKCKAKNTCNILVLLIKKLGSQSSAKPDFYKPVAIFPRWHIFCPFSDTLVLALLATGVAKVERARDKNDF